MTTSLTTLGAVAASAPPAGGAAVAEIVIASVSALVLTAGLLALGHGHRTGRVPVLTRLAGFSERVSGLPGWAALPAGIATGALLIAVFGMYWDISLHIDEGRDDGPLANPAHYFILLGLYGIFSAGFVAMVLPRERPGPSALRLTRTWHAPLGGVLLCACGAFSLTGFPLDDVWHRLFGQDVTLWGPTHLMLIGGAAMTLFGIAVLMVEGERALGGRRRERRWARTMRNVALPGAFLIGLSTFQAEFDFGVPQFRFVFQPMLIMAAAGIGLVATRVWLGRGSALGAVAFYLVVRGALALLVGPVLGETTPHLPLYVAEAVIVELVALVVSVRRPLAFGAACGVLLGTVGLAAEWGWSHVWMPLPWPAELLPEAGLLGFACALGGALIGAWAGARLNSDALPRGGGGLRVAAAAGAAVIFVLIAYGLHKPADAGVRAQVALQEASPAPGRTVHATVTLHPRDAADDAEWLTATAWQGGGTLVVDRLARVGEGVYATTRPLPVDGTWKALIRLHRGDSLTAVPVFLPDDPAIPAAAVPARARFERAFVADHEILQREGKSVAAGVSELAYGTVALIALALLALQAWGLHRLGATAPAAPPPTGRRTGGDGVRPAPGPAVAA